MVRSQPAQLLRQLRSARRPQGVTLAELLIYTVVAVAITAAVAGSLIAMIQNERNLEIQQRAIDLWSRISFLIESEVAEGSEILYQQPMPRCGGGSSLFTVLVPLDSGDTKRIHYHTRLMANNRVELMRCGPPYLANGSLHPSEPNRDALVGRNLVFQLIPKPTPESSRAVQYSLDIIRPDGKSAFLSPRITTARTRVAEVTGP